MNLKGKKVLVTGADGFIGSHLVEALLKEECKIKAFVYYNSFNSWGWLDTFPDEKIKKIEVIAGDIRDSNIVKEAVKGTDVIFHLAALIGIPYSYHSPESYIETNIKGTLNILQSAKDLGIERIIHTSTSEVYGTPEYVPIDENHPLRGQSPYSASKIGADKIAESFYLSFDVPIITARPFNTYGPRQSARAVIPTIISQLLNGGKEINLGSLYPTRDFNYVTDICKGFIALASCEKAVGKVINIGTGVEVSIKDVAEKIIGLINPDAKIVTEDRRKRPEKSEVERLICDYKLMTALTGWDPEIGLGEGLLKTIEWHKHGKKLNRFKWDKYNV